MPTTPPTRCRLFRKRPAAALLALAITPLLGASPAAAQPAEPPTSAQVPPAPAPPASAAPTATPPEPPPAPPEASAAPTATTAPAPTATDAPAAPVAPQPATAQAPPPYYGRPPYGPPAYGPPSYGPPSYGPPSYGPPSYGPPAYGPRPPAAPETDPLLPTGIALAVLGALSMVGGGIAYGESSSAGDELCGLSGCFTRPDHDLELGGVGLLAGGGAMLAMSIPVMAVGATGSTPLRNDDAMMTAGVVITGLATSSIVASIGALAAESASVQSFENESEAASAAVPMLIGGAAMLGLGIPLWAVGAKDWRAPELRDPDEPPGPGEESLPVGRKVERSPGMKVTGIVLTSLAGVGVVAGVGSLIAASDAQSSCRECDFAGMGETIAGAFCFGGAGLLAIVGIPLWAVGASETLVADGETATNPAPERAELVPELRIGPGSIQLRGRFQ